jgi:hypothetical protein
MPNFTSPTFAGKVRAGLREGLARGYFGVIPFLEDEGAVLLIRGIYRSSGKKRAPSLAPKS